MEDIRRDMVRLRKGLKGAKKGVFRGF